MMWRADLSNFRADSDNRGEGGRAAVRCSRLHEGDFAREGYFSMFRKEAVRCSIV